ncbi:MAG: pts system fructose component [Deltaproteobacteria bacterium]|jgi:PTS system mannose-specific IIA component|nr:pts system fructose component [Deltaproteobacteria bacterium]
MVGVVLVTHPHLGEEFIRSAEMICGKMLRILTVNIDTRKEVEELRRGIAEAIKKVDEGDGVLILTDMFGGTPSNMSLAFLQEDRVEVLTGLNLPMMIKLSNCREERRLKELARMVKEAGQKNINLASEILQKKS